MSPAVLKASSGKRIAGLRPRERRLALVAGTIIGCWVVVSWLMEPLWDRVHDLRAHVESQTEKLAALTRLLALEPHVERQYQQVAGYVTTDDDERAHSSFLNELEGLSGGADLQLNFKPRPIRREGGISRFEVELDVEGPQDKLFAFLDRLMAMPKLVAIDRLRISSVPTKEHVLRAGLVIQRLSFH